MQYFSRNCTYILTRTRGKKFENMFLVKIASKGTSLNTEMQCSSNNGSFMLSIMLNLQC